MLPEPVLEVGKVKPVNSRVCAVAKEEILISEENDFAIDGEFIVRFAAVLVLDDVKVVLFLKVCKELFNVFRSDVNSPNAEIDPKGVKTYCDANAPSFTPLDYTPEDLVYTAETPPPAYESEAPELPATPEIPSDLPRATPPSAKQNEETPPTPKETEPEPVPTQPVEAKATLTDFLPSPQQVTTTASIAVVATSAALLAKPLADLLLKLVKPAVKKAQKKLFGVFGKKTKVESVRERVLAQRDRNRLFSS